MFNISFYLEKFQAIKDPKIFKREIVAALNLATGHAPTDKEVSYKKGIVTIESNSHLRSEIFQKRAELIEKLSPTLQIVDIR